MNAAVICLGSVSSNMTIKAMKHYFRQVDLIDLKHIEVSIQDKIEVLYKGEPISHYDCVYAKGSFRYAELLRTITRAICHDTYMPIKASSFTTGHNKLLTHIKLQQYNIPQPTTYLASPGNAVKQILQKTKYPIVMKIPSGTQGKGVMFADSYSSASSFLDALESFKQPFIIQEFIETGGVDIRALVVGDQVVASMKRKAVVGEKRANIHAGGTGEPCVLDAKTKKVAVAAAKAIGAEVCGVDILESIKGPKVLEVNLSPGLQGITETTKIDVADKIASYFHKKTKEMVDSEKKSSSTKIMEDIEQADTKELITTIDMRGNRILLPEIITKLTQFNENEELVMKGAKGKLCIEEFKI